jgi:hypothetical protein
MVGRAAAAFAVASPIWLLLLVAIPQAGVSPATSFVIATAVTAVLAWAGIRWFVPASRRGATRREPRPPSPFAGTRRWLIGAAALIAVAYLVLVLRAGA